MIAKPRTTCRLCDGALRPVISLGDQYLVRFPEKMDESLPRAPLNLVQCEACGLLQLEHTTDPDLLFREFWYRSSVNQTMRDALQDVVDDVLTYRPHGKVWLDIGANDGYLLSRLSDHWERIACEPAQNFTAELQEHCKHVIPDFFSADHDCLSHLGRGRCDVITAIACFYDLDDPGKFLDDVVKVLAPGGVFVVQLNDSPTMLKRNAIDSICHEHLAYYDAHSLSRLFREHGLVITKLSYNETNAGSIRVFAHKEVAGLQPISLLGVPKADPEAVSLFAKRATRWKEEFGNLLTSFKGSIYGYGASTKGTALIQYLGCSDVIIAVADRNPRKSGKLMVGSWIPITDEVTFRRAKPDYAVVWPYAFKSEFLERERATMDAGTALVFPLPEVSICL